MTIKSFILLTNFMSAVLSTSCVFITSCYNSEISVSFWTGDFGQTCENKRLKVRSLYVNLVPKLQQVGCSLASVDHTQVRMTCVTPFPTQLCVYNLVKNGVQWGYQNVMPIQPMLCPLHSSNSVEPIFNQLNAALRSEGCGMEYRTNPSRGCTGRTDFTVCGF